MSDQRLGAAVRSVRVRRGLRQVDLAARARVSPTTVSRIERGRLEEASLSAVRAVAGALDIRVDVVARWRGGELERMLGRRHAALHEALARLFARRPGWQLIAEASFSIYGERGIVDALAWHPATRSLVVIELKSEIVDVQGLLGSVDRYRRLAPRVARERGLHPLVVSTWVIVADGRTNRRSVADHAGVLRNRFPIDGRTMRRWLRQPEGEVSALTFLPYVRETNARQLLSTSQRVRRGPAAGLEADSRGRSTADTTRPSKHIAQRSCGER
jgi:HTH-type transcriptional regulator / antitoxin HipB